MMKKVLMVLTMVFVLASVIAAKPMSPVVREQVEQLIARNEESISRDSKIKASTEKYIEWLETTDFSEKVINKADLKKVNGVKKELLLWLKGYRALGDVGINLTTKRNEGYRKALEENDSKYFYKPISKAEVELCSNVIEVETKLKSLDLKLKAILKLYGYN